MSLIPKIGLKKYLKVRDAFDGAWGTILTASNLDRIEIVYDTYLEVSFKESTRIGRAKEEPTKNINLNLDSPVPQEIKNVGHCRSVKCVVKYSQETTSL